MQSTNKALQAKTNDALQILDDIFFLVKVIAGKIYRSLNLVSVNLHFCEN